jgi:hypothetical protein
VEVVGGVADVEGDGVTALVSTDEFFSEAIGSAEVDGSAEVVGSVEVAGSSEVVSS